MNRSEIVELSSYRNACCVSVIARTHRRAPDNQQDPLVVKNLLNQAQERLLEYGTAREIEPIMERLSGLVESIEWDHTEDGLLLFASEDFSFMHQVPSPVRSRVVIDQTFATRDLLFSLSRSPHYRVLVLSEKPTRLYEGYRDQLVELRSPLFPIEHTGPGGAMPLPNPRNRNISQYRDEKHREFFREIDRRLGDIQTTQRLPLVVLGVDRYLAFFRETSSHVRHVVGTKEGSYDWQSVSELSKLAWPIMEQHLDSKVIQVLGELEAAVSANRYASAVDKVWKFAREGRVDTLLVEENYHISAGLDEDGNLVSEGGVSTMDDAIDELVEIVLQRGGEITFLPDGKLADHQKLAAILRY